MFNRKPVALIMASLAAISTLNGCSAAIRGVDVTSYPLSSPLTQQEVLDYYAESLAYDTVVSRSVETNQSNYVLKEVTDSAKIENIEKTLNITNQYLASNSYKSTDETSRYLSDSMYNYIRAMLNDKALSNPKITSINQALGYYFVDVEYQIEPAVIGTFKPTISLVGLSGSFKRSIATNQDSIDTAFMMNAQSKLNKYFEDNNINKTAEFIESGSFKISNSTQNGQTEQPDYSSSTIISTEDTENNEQSIDTITDDTIEDDNKKLDANTNNKIYSARTNGIDMNLYQDVVGFGINKAYIPELELVYNYPTSSDLTKISGIGLYPSGALGLSQFGVNRDGLTGTCNLRYIFKEDLVNPEILSCTNIYVTYYNITSGFSTNTDNLIPDFLSSEFSQLIERADRAMVDCDIAALSNGKIFEDIGMAVLQGYTEEYGNVIRQISTLRRIISRDIENNTYLIEIESYRQEGAESADAYPSYKDTIYAVVEQSGSDFIITDWMTMQRQLMTEPDIDPDKATAKRVVALGLTGEVSDETKENAQSLLNELYTASTNRVLTGPITLEDGTTLERGMYDCFNSNPEMLSSSRKEEINSDIRQILVKYGVNTKSTMIGQVTEWIGGSENQVEFTTEELVTYQGHSDAVYMTCYYLVSNLEDKWVIDDIQVLSEESVSGDAVNSIQSRFS